MIILNEPYVSQFLLKTAEDFDIPVVDCSPDRSMTAGFPALTEQEFVAMAQKKSPLALYCNSENSFSWLSRNFKDTEIPAMIELFKDKVQFRKLVKRLYPEFSFAEVAYEDLATFDTSKIKKPFIIKPAVGFFSMGVYKVESDRDWNDIVLSIQAEMDKVRGLYPLEVMNASKFIIEEFIKGSEYAIDAYYDSHGEPVILNILEHPFASNGDVSDRLYFTSRKIVKKHLAKFSELLAAIGAVGKISSFPIHMEVRVDESGQVIPIEVNPMRFAGWCTTDIAHYAYGINVYEMYLQQKRPDWDQILCREDKALYCIVVGDVPGDVRFQDIKKVDYPAYAANFSNLLELRKVDYKKYPVFAFAFISIAEDPEVIDELLQLDTRPYIA